MKKKISLLIVDDSRIFRSALEKSLCDVKDIEVIGSVFSGSKAIEFIESHRPEVVTLDVEMPGMDGFETLKAIQRINEVTPGQSPIGVIMLSAFTEKVADMTIRALEAGAFDFITKPRASNAREGIRTIRSRLLVKIRHYMNRPAGSGRIEKAAVKKTPRLHSPAPPSSVQAVLIGSSTGGPKALGKILPALCEKIDTPVLVVQHMPATFTASLAKSLSRQCRHTVTEGKDKEIVTPGHVYIAPGGKHMLVRKNGNRSHLVINEQPPELGCRPSVNILFRSAAAAFGENTAAVILTGMGTDGKSGVKALKRAGACIIIQDEVSSVVWGMPKSALETGCVDDIVPLSLIAEHLAYHINSR